MNVFNIRAEKDTIQVLVAPGQQPEFERGYGIGSHPITSIEEPLTVAEEVKEILNQRADDSHMESSPLDNPALVLGVMTAVNERREAEEHEELTAAVGTNHGGSE